MVPTYQKNITGHGSYDKLGQLNTSHAAGFDSLESLKFKEFKSTPVKHSYYLLMTIH